MRSFFSAFLTLIISTLPIEDAQAGQHYEVFTDLGMIYIETFDDESPLTVENFNQYVEDEFYSQLLFHRVIKDFVVQTGGFNTKLEYQETRDPIVNESMNGLKNTRGTLAMARNSDPNSADSQFFINLRDNPHLNATSEKLGYTVFAKVTCGMNVADLIGNDPTRTYEMFSNLPKNPIRLIWIKPIESDHNDYIKCKR